MQAKLFKLCPERRYFELLRNYSDAPRKHAETVWRATVTPPFVCQSGEGPPPVVVSDLLPREDPPRREDPVTVLSYKGARIIKYASLLLELIIYIVESQRVEPSSLTLILICIFPHRGPSTSLGNRTAGRSG
jgi:hypothetical protein